MSGQVVGGLAMGSFACLLAVGGIVAAIRRRNRRAEIAATYGQTGGVAYTVVQLGCSALLLIAGLGLIVLTLVLTR